MLTFTWFLAASAAEGEPAPTEDEPERAVAAPAPEPAPAPAASPSLMVGHFVQATTAMLATAIGRVDVARDHALALADTAGVPPELATVARALGECKKVSCAAPAVAAMGTTCADCHLTTGRGPLPHDMGTIPGRDARERHIYAATFAWVGLVTPKQPTLLMGLSNVVPPIDRASAPPKVAEASEVFRAAVERAVAAESLEDRSAAFGQVLVACDGCHATTLDHHR